MCERRIVTLGRHFFPQEKPLPPIKVTVTGAAGNIGYALVFMIAQGRMFGPNQPVELTLLEIPQAEQALKGVIMELKDCSFPLVVGFQGVTNYQEGFRNCQMAVLVGARPRGPGMERKDLLTANAEIFKGQGKAINEYADRNCKVVVVGNPANTNALICSIYADKIPKENFTALTRLDQNRAVFQIADRLNTHVDNIKNIIIWGNHSATQYADVSYGYVANHPSAGMTTSITGALNDQKWIQSDFITTVAQRGAEIIKARKLSSAASAASSVCDHVHDWLIGTKPGEYVSMGVISDGSYGVPKGIVFSFPVVCKEGRYQIVQGLKWSEFSKQKIDITTKELLEERKLALGE